ncbi:DUF3459 domain-containing protein, partial [Actinoplanes sp. NPDC048791]|uniref:DUF3459 domain-containing protein n=1 Tax=Actinoplanes sp. NPDC048791 TaxID=3154623 RepID=UPI0033C952A1
RRADPALGGADNLRWCEGPDGLLVFERGDSLRCTVNMTDAPIRIPRPGHALLTSGPVDLSGAEAEIPADTTVWWVPGSPDGAS